MGDGACEDAYKIGQGVPPKDAVKTVGMVVEGINAIPATLQLAKKYGPMSRNSAK